MCCPATAASTSSPIPARWPTRSSSRRMPRRSAPHWPKARGRRPVWHSRKSVEEKEGEDGRAGGWLDPTDGGEGGKSDDDPAIARQRRRLGEKPARVDDQACHERRHQRGRDGPHSSFWLSGWRLV